MYYGLEKTLKRLENAVCGYQKTLKEMSHTVTEQQEDLKEMKRKLEFTSSELASSRFALSDMTNQLQKAVTQRDTARKEV